MEMSKRKLEQNQASRGKEDGGKDPWKESVIEVGSKGSWEPKGDRVFRRDNE